MIKYTPKSSSRLSLDESWVKRQEEFSNQPGDRTDVMVATGPLQTAIHNAPVPRKEGDYGEKKAILSGIQKSTKTPKANFLFSLNPVNQLTPR